MLSFILQRDILLSQKERLLNNSLNNYTIIILDVYFLNFSFRTKLIDPLYFYVYYFYIYNRSLVIIVIIVIMVVIITSSH